MKDQQLLLKQKIQKNSFRQIAGAVARRICNYANEGQIINQKMEAGFIKFGSRIDVFRIKKVLP